MARPRKGEKDQVLVEAAIRLFLENGVKKTTIQDIARMAEVAVGTVYIYHKDKVSIVRRVAYAIAEQHHAFAQSILDSERSPPEKLKDYVLGLYDIWKPFGVNSDGAVELAEAVLKFAPETPELAQKEFIATLEKILTEARKAGMNVRKPVEEARWIVLSTAIFFPFAGTPSINPSGSPLTRADLAGVLQWIGRNMAVQIK